MRRIPQKKNRRRLIYPQPPTVLNYPPGYSGASNSRLNPVIAKREATLNERTIIHSQPYLPGSAGQYAHDARGGSKDVETLTGLFKDKPYPPGSTHCPRVTLVEGWPCYAYTYIRTYR